MQLEMLMGLVWEFLSVFHCQVDRLDFVPTHRDRHPLLKGLNGDIHKTPDKYDQPPVMCPQAEV
ncbi:hypothetical protein L798_01173 [Zootermopsis nevadensis]|uniref:Uncharacterized protein n=1 Tax=Zootermopsis nevadensis TaxID=136037 RepID=A0A067RGZ8_ZOONE|nr:hypothetical protein L798_01173 [Zootermopsis nevadensis]